MDVYNSEEQQVEAIKGWWKENGKSIIAGVVIGFIGLFGWRYYNDYTRQQNEIASAEYQHVLQALSAQHEKAFDDVSKFIAAHKNTYGDLASLQLSAEAIKAHKFELAVEQLRRVADQASDEELKPIAAIRLARVLIATDKATDALKVLDAVTTASYKATIDQVRGDALLALSQPEKARNAYLAALKESKNGQDPVLQMKLDDLSATNEKVDTAVAK